MVLISPGKQSETVLLEPYHIFTLKHRRNTRVISKHRWQIKMSRAYCHCRRISTPRSQLTKRVVAMILFKFKSLGKFSIQGNVRKFTPFPT